MNGPNFVSPQIGNVGFESDLGEQAGDFGPQPAGCKRFFHCGAAQNIAYFLFHAAAVPPRTALQSGGAGSGAWSSGATEAGGAGANGQIKVTPYSSQAFKTLIAHRPPPGALKTFQPLVSVGGGNDAPDGTHAYQMPQPLTGVNADFGGTYTIYLVNYS